MRILVAFGLALYTAISSGLALTGGDPKSLSAAPTMVGFVLFNAPFVALLFVLCSTGTWVAAWHVSKRSVLQGLALAFVLTWATYVLCLAVWLQLGIMFFSEDLPFTVLKLGWMGLVFATTAPPLVAWLVQRPSRATRPPA